jgi:DNA-binding LacI/PurR family transcriptional regulator
MGETLEVPVTTVGPDLESLARTTLEHLLSPKSDKEPYSAVTLEMELVVRDSTVPPAANR